MKRNKLNEMNDMNMNEMKKTVAYECNFRHLNNMENNQTINIERYSFSLIVNIKEKTTNISKTLQGCSILK